ncbi:MAG: PP2C family protein-serine/threonine phosphatase, partial [Planctomycetota bacterium]
GNTARATESILGHGLDAALFVASARALLRTSLADGHPPARAAQRANAFLCSDMDDGRFMTLFLGIYSARESELAYVNAGQNKPLIVGPAGVRSLDRTGLPLGLVADGPAYTTRRLPVSPDENLLLFTDGLRATPPATCSGGNGSSTFSGCTRRRSRT